MVFAGEKLPMEWLRLIGARLSVGLLCTIIILTFWVVQLHHVRQLEMRRAMEHATEVRSSLGAVLSALKDAEIGERGYLITGQPEYLDAYESARRQLPTLINRFKSQIASDPAQLVQLQGIAPLVFARLDELQEAIDARRARGFEAAEAVVRTNAPKATMQQVQDRVAEAERANDSRLREHMEPALGLGTMLGTAALSGLIAFGLTSAGFRLGRRKNLLEEAIRENEALLRTVLAQMPSGVVIADVAGRLLMGNGQMERIWREPFRPAASMADYKLYKGFHTDRRPYDPEEWPLSRSLRYGETVESELLYFLRGDHTCGAMEISSAPIRDRRGNIIAAVATFHDVSERHEIERQLRRSQRAFQSLVEHLPDVVFRLNPELRHAYMSPVVEQYAGIPSEAFIGKTICEMGFEREACERFEAHCREVLAGGGESRFEFQRNGRHHRCRLVAESGSNGAVECILGICEDVTAQKLAELALRHSEERLRLAQRAANAGVWDWDIANRRLYWSDEAFQLFGLRPGAFEPSGESWMDLVHPDDRPRVREMVAACLSQARDSFDSEYRIVRPDGSVCWVEDRGQIFYDAAGRPARMLGINIDITARREAEEATRRQANLLEQTHDAILVRGYDGTIIYWNRGAEALYGYSREEALGCISHRLFGTVCPADIDALETGLLREGRWEGELIHATRDRRRITVESRQLLMEEGDGKLLVLETNRDITERRETLERLRLSEERLAMAQEAGGVGVFDWDPVTGEVFWSRQLETIFGLPPGGFGGRYENWTRQVHPEDLPRLEALFETLMSGEPPGEAGWEYRIFRTDGELRWISAQARVVFEAAGKPVRVIGISIDVTPRKLAEQALREADRRKDEFLAMLAHELRNPLAPIRNAIEVLRRVGTADPKQHWAREVLQRQVGQLTRLVDDLLDVSRITRGKIRIKREVLDLREIVDQAVEISYPLFLAKGHVLSVAVPDGPLRVEGDRARLVQVVSNLLNNAAKYTADNGRIEADIEATPDAAVIRVADNGIGIAPELLPHIFEPFRQADETLARSQGGLGVGLTLVQRLVELHGGRVVAHSEGLGRGTVFTVVLPRAGG
jgi:PAS domain S-box-containing protein